MKKQLTALLIPDSLEHGNYKYFRKIATGTGAEHLPVLLHSTVKGTELEKPEHAIIVYGNEPALLEYSKRLKAIPIGHRFFYDLEQPA